MQEPIFEDKLKKISWKKIYAREYGVQYSEMAILCLTDRARYHIPKPSLFQVVIPEGENTAFYIDDVSWIKLVESLNKRYTSDLEQLKHYENQFFHDAETYLKTAKNIAKLNSKKLSNKELKDIYLDYQEKLFLYSVFAWTSFILNNYVAERAESILDKYIKKAGRENQKQFFLDSLFKPLKKAAILDLQERLRKHKGKLSLSSLSDLYEKFKWVACLDIHNKPWTKEEFRSHTESMSEAQTKQTKPFPQIAKELKITSGDLNYLLMAQRFVYIKDARDDFRRQGVYHALTFFKELARRIGISPEEVSYLQESEVLSFLAGRLEITKKLARERRRGFVLYLDKNKKLICLTGREATFALKKFQLLFKNEKDKVKLRGSVASQGMATGRVVVIHGVKDLGKVKDGDILVAVTTHPDYVPAMRKAVAIVTDEGGITSHAAIVSREFGIPCIVGTKHAISILRDGEMVEVNAIEGWVKKLR